MYEKRNIVQMKEIHSEVLFIHLQSIAFKFDDTLFSIEPDTSCDFDFVKISGDGMASSHGNRSVSLQILANDLI